jgi:hypothetical protein
MTYQSPPPPVLKIGLMDPVRFDRAVQPFTEYTCASDTRMLNTSFEKDFVASELSLSMSFPRI